MLKANLGKSHFLFFRSSYSWGQSSTTKVKRDVNTLSDNLIPMSSKKNGQFTPSKVSNLGHHIRFSTRHFQIQLFSYSGNSILFSGMYFFAHLRDQTNMDRNNLKG